MAKHERVTPCEMMIFCSPEESMTQERECSDTGVAFCNNCGKAFCEDNDHGDSISELCRECLDDEDDDEYS